MPFTLRSVGAGCYALLFRDEHIGSVFASEDDHPEPWVAIVHDRWAPPRAPLPPPFQSKEHRFVTFRDLREWLRGTGPRITHMKME